MSFDKAQKYENGQDRIFSRPWRDMAPNYIFGSLPLRGFFSVCFIVFVVFVIFVSLVFTFFHHVSLLFIVFQLFNLILWALIRLKNMKTDKIEYFETLEWHGSKLLGFFPLCVWKCSYVDFHNTYVHIYSGCIGFIGFKSVGAMPTRNSHLLPVHRVVAPHTLNLRF